MGIFSSFDTSCTFVIHFTAERKYTKSQLACFCYIRTVCYTESETGIHPFIGIRPTDGWNEVETQGGGKDKNASRQKKTFAIEKSKVFECVSRRASKSRRPLMRKPLNFPLACFGSSVLLSPSLAAT